MIKAFESKDPEHYTWKRYSIFSYWPVSNKDAETYKVKKYSKPIDRFDELIHKIEKENEEMKNKIMIKSNTQIVDWGNYCIIIYNKMVNYVYTTGKLISKEWFIAVTHFIERIAIVQKENKKRNYLNLNWKLLSEQRFDEIYNFKEWRWWWIINNKKYKINEAGELYPIN